MKASVSLLVNGVSVESYDESDEPQFTSTIKRILNVGDKVAIRVNAATDVVPPPTFVARGLKCRLSIERLRVVG